MKPNDYMLYDRVTDQVYYLSKNIHMSFITRLSWKKQDGSRAFFHAEYEKQSQYVGTQTSRTIKRNLSFYFLIEEKGDINNSFLLRPRDVIILIKLLDNNVFPWFHGDTRVFDIVDKKLVIKGTYSPAVYAQSTYAYLAFTPVVYEYQTGEFKEGVHITMNNTDTTWDMTIDDLYGFYYILTNTSMYNLAAELATYAKVPPYGVNLTQLRGLGSGEPTSSNAGIGSAAKFLNSK